MVWSAVDGKINRLEGGSPGTPRVIIVIRILNLRPSICYRAWADSYSNDVDDLKYSDISDAEIHADSGLPEHAWDEVDGGKPW